MTWTTLTMRVATPLFNGGADAGPPDPDGTGVRVASIRGAMRFWFRALAGALTGPDLRLLGSMERRVFGGAGEGGAVASPLLLRIAGQPRVRQDSAPGFIDRRDGKWIAYLLGPGITKYNQGARRLELNRPFVDAGEEFELKIGFRHPRGASSSERKAVEGLALASLWLTCTYGGIGARTRRGFGGLRIVDVSDGDSLPEPWNAGNALLTPGADYYDGLDKIWVSDPLTACMPYLQTLDRGGQLIPRAWEGKLPEFPVLSPAGDTAGVRGNAEEPFRGWRDTLVFSGEELRHFRASEPNTRPGARYSPCIETPEWRETIHGKRKSRFPVGALGLPVIMKDGYEVHADAVPPAEGKGRRASPLWIRAVGSGSDWRLLTFAFQSEFLPSGVRLLHKKDRPRRLEITDDDVTRQTRQWIKVMRDNQSFVPYREGDGGLVPDERRDTGGL